MSTVVLRRLVWSTGLVLWLAGVIVIAQATWHAQDTHTVVPFALIVRSTMQEGIGILTMVLSRWVR